MEETRTVHHGWLMASFAAAEFAGGLAMLIFGTQDGDGDLDALRFIGLSLTGGILINLSIVDAIWGGIRLFQKDGVQEEIAGKNRVTYVAKLEGDARSADLTIPQTDVLLTFPRDQVAKSWVIAVMGVEDAAAATEQALSGVLMTNISDQLRTFIAQKVRTIDRGTQEQALIQSIKQESYDSCFDEACQIELGRALAATHIIRGRVTRFGERCILNVALVDLTSEVTVNAASAQGGCQDESFLEMSEVAARDLMKQ
jgi:TolB-like protein